MTFIDTNVLLDVVTNDATWANWSLARLDAASLRGPLLINDTIYAEFSVRFDRMELVDAVISAAGLVMEPMPRPALFLAAKAFKTYRSASGTRTGVLPDFFIGAHAAVTGRPLLTRDPKRYRTYFPTVELVTP